MGVFVRISGTLPMRVPVHSWHTGDRALCGANRVRVAALEGDRALVVGEAHWGEWTIWMEASKLRICEEPETATPPAIR